MSFFSSSLFINFVKHFDSINLVSACLGFDRLIVTLHTAENFGFHL